MNLTQLLTFFLTIVLSSAFCFGLHVVAKNLLAELVSDVDELWEGLSRGSKLFYKPLIACPYCMASYWGTMAFLAFLYPAFSIWWWPVFCICLCGFNYVMNQFVNE